MLIEQRCIPVAAYCSEAHDGAIEFLQANNALSHINFELEGVDHIEEKGASWIQLQHQGMVISVLEDDCDPKLLSDLKIGVTLTEIYGPNLGNKITYGREYGSLVAAVLDNQKKPLFCSLGLKLPEYLEMHPL